MIAGAPEWRHRLKAPLPPMAATLQSLELKLLMDSADLGHVPEYFDSLVALPALILAAAGLRVSALPKLFMSVSFPPFLADQVTLAIIFRSCGRGAT